MKHHPFAMLEHLETRTLMSLTVKTAFLPPATPPTGTIITTPTPSAGTGLTLNLTAGVPFSGQVAFYPSPVLDPPLAYSASINWGDGTVTAATLAYGTQGNTGGYVISGAHTYSRAGTFKMVTTVMTGPLITPGQPPMLFPTRIVAQINGQAIVTASPPSSSGGVTLHETAGQSFTADLGSFITLAPATRLTATIAWGDGTSSTGQLKPMGIVGLDQIQFDVLGTHTYAQAGTFSIHISVVKTTLNPTPMATPPLVVATIQSLAVVTSPAPLSLAGTLQGTYTFTLANPDTGKSYHLAGSGDAGTLGAVTAQATIRLPGFVANGHAQGTLTLANASGTITLALTGPPTPAFSALPATLTYLMTQGTGAYLGDSACGTITITLIPSSSATGDNHFSLLLT